MLSESSKTSTKESRSRVAVAGAADVAQAASLR
jgi:hypothetical protein